MRIHTDHNGVYVNAISTLPDGTDVTGHVYYITSGNKTTEIVFQQGPIGDVGVNGVTNEALLAIVADRIGFLNGKFPCRENSIALTKIQEGLMWLLARTANRQQRGVEGKNLA